MSTQTLSQYDKQAADFLAKYGVGFRATLAKTQTAPQWGKDDKHGSRYRVTLSRSNKRPSRLVFDFWGSYAETRSAEQNAAVITAARARITLNQRKADEASAWRIENQKNVPHYLREVEAARREIAECKAFQPKTPGAYDVLACISSDANCPETFADFCAEYGYESDSIAALQTFRRCAAFGKRLRAFFTADELAALSEIQ